MSNIIEGVYHNGTIELLQKVLIQENKRLKIVIMEDEKDYDRNLKNLSPIDSKQELIYSADLYNELYNSDPDLKNLTNSYVSEWPE
jgi:predicted DNA-binding antitoxin AbrB/MazE fold protein